ncbi:helix-turn-helix domain-containing protein [Cohnella sp. GbtcB17]|uniref:helix-turn-helix domain-containing protein n=1 Tax=Cohnella sp. GbtcB17 TaxID=2824762 RepID=UPI001C30FFE5|nr:helix-turn-helix domain-containing protein [Cohnella sp. GbtcB17]
MKSSSEKVQYARSAIYTLLGLLEPEEANAVLNHLNERFGRSLLIKQDLPRVFTCEELAKRWRLHANTVRLLAANDSRLGAFKQGRRWLVRQDSLDAYEQAKTAKKIKR